MEFWDKPEVRFLQSVILEDAKDFELYADITPSYFQDPHLAKIWEAILQTWKPNWNAGLDFAANAANLLGLGSKASDNLADLLRLEPYGTAPYWATFIREGAKKLPKLKLAELMSKENLSSTDFEEMDRLFREITKPLEADRETTPLEDFLADIDELDKEETIYPTNYPSLDNYLEGFRPGNYYLVAGRTGTGKTSIALNLATNLRNAKAVFYSLEMRSIETRRREISIRTGKPRPKEITEDYKREVAEFAYSQQNLFKIQKAPEGGFTLQALMADIKKKVRRDKYEIVFIDQLDTIAKTGRYATETDRISDYSSQLRQLAKDLEIPLVLLVQINREGKDEPQLHHLKQSGQLEQDAAVVLLLDKKDPDAINTELIVKIAKNRFGRTGKVFFNWKGELQRIEEKPDYYARPTNPADLTSLSVSETF